MTPKTDSVAVLRELRAECGDDPTRFTLERAALDAAIVALSAQGEEVAVVDEDHGLKGVTLLDRSLPVGTKLYLHPAPPGADAVTEEMVARARDALIDHDAGPDYVSSNAMHAALTAALAARTGKGEG